MTTLLAPGLRLGDVTLETLLQASGDLATWRGFRTDGSQVVVKVLTEPDRGLIRTLQRSFRRTHGLRVDGVAGPLELHLDGEPRWMVRDWVDGVALLDALRETPIERRVERTLHLGALLFERLAALHREGLVHGHLRSGNVWATPDDNVVLTDLGSSVRRLLPRAANTPGQLPPRSPEEMAGWAARAATDVLGAGAMLYAALAPTPSDSTDHTLPWGSTAREALPGLAIRVREVPRRLCRLLAQTQLLDPTDRPSAAEMARHLADPGITTEPAPLPPCPARIGQADVYESALTHLRGKGARMLLLHGPTGSGRRRLADTLGRARLRDGRPTLRISAQRDEVGSIIVGTLQRLVGPDQHAARRQRLLRGVAGPLGTLWPELVPSESRRTGHQDVNQVLDAATTVATRACDDRPALWLMEDLEDADPLSLRWLRRLAEVQDADLEIIGVYDDRWQTDELARLRTRLADHASVRAIGLRDISARSAFLITELLTRALPDTERPDLRDSGPSVSPARVTEQAHSVLAHWRGEREPPPDVGATVFALAPELPAAALERLGFDPHKLVKRGIAVAHRPGWLTAAHEGVVELGRRGLHRRDKLAQRLADVLEQVRAPAILVARVRLFTAKPSRTAAARAAITAWDDDQPGAARRWLHVTERLPRDRDNPDYQDLRPTLARVRAEIAHVDANANTRPELLQQAERRARTRAEKAELHAARGLTHMRSGLAEPALEAWRTGAHDPEASPRARARCAGILFDHTLSTGQMVHAGQAVQQLHRLCRESTATRAMHRSAAVRAALYSLAQGEPGAALQRLHEWQLGHPGKDVAVDLLRAEAAWQSGRVATARQTIANCLDDNPLDPDALAFHALIALDRGDTRTARRTQRRLQQLNASGPWQVPMTLRLTVAQGEQAHLQPLLGAGAPTRRPDHRAAWLTASLDVLRMVSEPAIRSARIEEAKRGAASSPFPDLHIALAWHLLDVGDMDGAAARATTAEDLARHLGDPGRILRARLLHSAATGVSMGAWTYLMERARQVGSLPLLTDALELSVVTARRHQSQEGVEAAIHELSQLALSGPDHGLAARATRLARRSSTPIS